MPPRPPMRGLRLVAVALALVAWALWTRDRKPAEEPDDFSAIPVPVRDSPRTKNGIPLEFLKLGRRNAPPLDFVIDIGLNDGESLATLHETIPWATDAIRLGFECNPRFVRLLTPHSATHNYTLFDYCAWTQNGTMPLFIDEHFEDAAGTSLMKEHSRAQAGKTHQAKTLDFARFLGQLVREQDRVFVKMDIEGAEFAVVRELIVTPAPASALLDPTLGSMPTICLIDNFALEEHYEEKLRPPALKPRVRTDDDRNNAPRIDSRLKDFVEYLGDTVTFEGDEPEPENKEESEDDNGESQEDADKPRIKEKDDKSEKEVARAQRRALTPVDMQPRRRRPKCKIKYMDWW